jgi:urease accessory protein
MRGLPALLMLADSRLPAGGHAHSGGVETALSVGVIGDLPDLAVFLRGRLRTAGTVAAGLAAAACAAAQRPDAVREFAVLDREADARMPSPAQRTASRQQGRSLLRAARSAWPAAYLDELARVPAHHAVALGASAAAAGADPRGAAQVAAYLSVTGPASAAVRLRGFDPLAVNALIADLAPDIAGVTGEMSAASAPRLDLLAEVHARAEVRLFAS